MIDLIGMQMEFVMTWTTMKPAFLMVEIAVDLVMIIFIAPNVNAFLKEKKVRALQPQHFVTVPTQIMLVSVVTIVEFLSESVQN